MGTEARLIATHADADVLERARERLAQLEARWSRFLPDSELSRLNRLAGRPVVVSSETFELVSRAIQGWYASDGRFDPTVLDALVASGYDRTFADIDLRDDRPAPPPVPAAGCAGIELLDAISAVKLPPQVHLDLGGIGKGHAADIVAREIVAAGAAGACVDLGGDVRVLGAGPGGGPWTVEVSGADPDGPALVTLSLLDGAVVTTTPRLRAWQRGGRQHHHLIDPTTGAAAMRGIASVTVVANEASLAEVLAKAAYLAGVDDGIALLDGAGVTGVIVDDAGTAHRVADLDRYLADH